MGKSRGKRARPPTVAFATWHRRVGLGAALLVLWLAASGILLNHTDALGLDQHHVRAGWLLDWYGIEAPARIRGYAVDGHWLTQVAERIYYDGQPLRGEYARLAGAARLDGEIAVATEEKILLLTPDGRLAEVLGAAHGVPPGIERLGVHAGRLVARTAHGDFAAAPGLVGWQAIGEAPEADWARPAEVPGALRERLIADYRGRILTLERLLLDLHSGRLFGLPGVLLMDLAAIGFLLLAITGFWMWLLRNNNGRGRNNGRK